MKRVPVYLTSLQIRVLLCLVAIRRTKLTRTPTYVIGELLPEESALLFETMEGALRKGAHRANGVPERLLASQDAGGGE